MKNTNIEFEHLYEVVKSQSFLSMEALGGEIPFWIYPYKPQKQKHVDIELINLHNKLTKNNVKSLTVDLLEISLQIINEQVGLTTVFSVEKDKTKDKLKSALQSILNIHERFIPHIREQVIASNCEVLFIKGVGSVFPFIRSHTVLNNLQSAIKDIPILMFFLGEYTGQSLNLFAKLKDDNYYRAFNILEYKLI